MGLTTKKEEQLRQMPLIKSRVSKSKDGKYLIHKVEITSIKPAAYYEAVLRNEESVSEETDEELQALTA
jgi:hypothetical protein